MFTGCRQALAAEGRAPSSRKPDRRRSGFHASGSRNTSRRGALNQTASFFSRRFAPQCFQTRTKGRISGMTGAKEFEAFLAEAAGPYPRLRAAADALRAIASAVIELSNLIGLGRLYGQLGAARGSTNIDGDVQKELDILANDMFVRAVRQAPVGENIELLLHIAVDVSAPPC